MREQCERCGCAIDPRGHSRGLCEYLRRNNLVAKANGAKAGLLNAIARLESTASAPKWLLEKLRGVLDRIEPLPAELADHRNEV